VLDSTPNEYIPLKKHATSGILKGLKHEIFWCRFFIKPSLLVSVVDPKLFFPDPDPTFQESSDPAPDPDPISDPT